MMNFEFVCSEVSKVADKRDLLGSLHAVPDVLHKI